MPPPVVRKKEEENYDDYQIRCKSEPRTCSAPTYVQRIDRIPVQMTTNRKLA
jgi:hypothetical protein